MVYRKQDLAYCSNVHPGATLAAVKANIQQHFSTVRGKRDLEIMASGLWLSADVAQQLWDSTDELASFKHLLEQQGVALTTLNGFPFGDFHQTIVKQNVYLPTWADDERLAYTQNLANILAECLPHNQACGAISTLPLAYAQDWSADSHQHAISHLLSLTEHLIVLEQQSGKQIIVCIEMEPDCVLQYTQELVRFFVQDLLPAAQQRGLKKEQVLRYIGCCYDTCHQAVMGEHISQSLQQIEQAGIALGKIQISNAVQARLSSTEQIEQLTATFADTKFLHQTKVFVDGKFTRSLDDLSAQALEHTRVSCTERHSSIDARIHYHIPINQSAEDLPLTFLSATQEAIFSTLDFLQNRVLHAPNAPMPYLEVETYTWLNFLQGKADKTARLHQGFVAEFSWLEQALRARNLLKA